MCDVTDRVQDVRTLTLLTSMLTLWTTFHCQHQHKMLTLCQSAFLNHHGKVCCYYCV